MYRSDPSTPPEMAQRLLDCHGDDADLYALERYNERVIAGDMAGCLAWRRVVALVSEALRNRRRAG